MMLRLSHVEALRSDLKQYDRILLGQSNACFYVGTYSTLLLNLFCLFYDDIDFLFALLKNRLVSFFGGLFYSE